MKLRLTVEQTSKQDGLGRPVHGWYVCSYGVPLGCARATEAEANADAIEYARDMSRNIRECR